MNEHIYESNAARAPMAVHVSNWKLVEGNVYMQGEYVLYTMVRQATYLIAGVHDI